jgi:hypothetical protein
MGGTDPITRWLLEAKDDEPWFMLDILDSTHSRNAYQLVGRIVAELDDNWSVRAESGSFQGERISKHYY